MDSYGRRRRSVDDEDESTQSSEEGTYTTEIPSDLSSSSEDEETFVPILAPMEAILVDGHLYKDGDADPSITALATSDSNNNTTSEETLLSSNASTEDIVSDTNVTLKRASQEESVNATRRSKQFQVEPPLIPQAQTWYGPATPSDAWRYTQVPKEIEELPPLPEGGSHPPHFHALPNGHPPTLLTGQKRFPNESRPFSFNPTSGNPEMDTNKWHSISSAPAPSPVQAPTLEVRGGNPPGLQPHEHTLPLPGPNGGFNGGFPPIMNDPKLALRGAKPPIAQQRENRNFNGGFNRGMDGPTSRNGQNLNGGEVPNHVRHGMYPYQTGPAGFAGNQLNGSPQGQRGDLSVPGYGNMGPNSMREPVPPPEAFQTIYATTEKPIPEELPLSFAIMVGQEQGAEDAPWSIERVPRPAATTTASPQTLCSSQTTIIATAVTVTLVHIGLIAAVVCWYRWQKKKKLRKNLEEEETFPAATAVAPTPSTSGRGTTYYASPEVTFRSVYGVYESPP